MPDSTRKSFAESRVNMPTGMSSREIAQNIPPEIRARAFFSARVAESHILERFRQISDAYSSGEISRDEARHLLRQFARENGRDDGTKGLRNLASTARLNLILDQNAKMARAVAQYEAMHRPANLKIFPYVIYRASVGSRSPRDSHRRYDGMIIDKRDPWLRTHWPPWEFGCNCDLENCSAKKAATLGTVKPMSDPEDVKVESESGFAFDPAHAFEEFDLSLIKDAGDRARAAEGLQREFACKISEDGLVASTPKEDETQKLQFVDRRPGPKVQKAVKALEASVERVDFNGMPEDAAPLVREASEQIARRAKEYGLHFSYVGTNDHSSTRTPLSPNTVFEALGPDEKTGRMELIFNAKTFSDPDLLRDRLVRSVENGFHPAECDTIAAYVDHEISHFLFTIARMDEDEEFMQAMRQLKAHPDLVSESISGYALKYTGKDDVSFAQEVLAECFMSVKQHPLSSPKKHKEIVEMLENRLKRSILKQKERK